jgi:hypothetical protein
VTGAGTRRARADAAIRAAPGPLPPVLLFACAEDWAAWLEAYRATAPGAWLRLARKGAPLRTIAYAEAVEAALCYGWIDSLARRCDEASWAQRFTRRGARSRWSPASRAKVAALAAAGRMGSAGLLAVDVTALRPACLPESGWCGSPSDSDERWKDSSRRKRQTLAGTRPTWRPACSRAVRGTPATLRAVACERVAMGKRQAARTTAAVRGPACPAR